MTSRLQQLRRWANLLNFSTPAGLLIARMGRADLQRDDDGIWLAEGYELGFPIAGAFTVGNVVVVKGSLTDLQQQQPQVLEHELRHTWQYAALGTTFLPAYLVAMGWSWVRTGDRASRNLFERWAGLADGGYRDLPVRPIWRRKPTN